MKITRDVKITYFKGKVAVLIDGSYYKFYAI